ncbi:MAG: hypothetical protein IJH39_11550 [Clostridia bacterium]|nr:hypothetical protein [Clostridia bacterium]
MNIKGIEIDFDFLDADNVEKFETEAKKVIEKTEKKEIVELSYAEALRKECEIVEDFIDNVFGKGISEQIFKGKHNLGEHIQVFQLIVDEKNKKQEELEKIMSRYLPRKEERRRK